MSVRLTVTAKGQVTLRRGVLDHLGVRAGQQVVADLLPDGKVELRPERDPTSFAALRGILQRPGQPRLTIEQINEGIGQGAVDAYEESLGIERSER